MNGVTEPLSPRLRVCAGCEQDISLLVAPAGTGRCVMLPCFHTLCCTCMKAMFTTDDCKACPARIGGGNDARCGQMCGPADLVHHMLVDADVLWCRTPGCGTDNNLFTHTCQECKEFLCGTCVIAHKRVSLTSKHRIYENRELNKWTGILRLTGRCEIHPTNAVTYHCTTCSISLCNDCRINHPGHVLHIIEILKRKWLGEYDGHIHNMQKKAEELGNTNAKEEYNLMQYHQLMTNIFDTAQTDITQLSVSDGSRLRAIITELVSRMNEKLNIVKQNVRKNLYAIEILLQVRTFCEGVRKLKQLDSVYYLKPLIDKQQIELAKYKYDMPQILVIDGRGLESWVERLSSRMRPLIESLLSVECERQRPTIPSPGLPDSPIQHMQNLAQQPMQQIQHLQNIAQQPMQNHHYAQNAAPIYPLVSTPPYMGNVRPAMPANGVYQNANYANASMPMYMCNVGPIPNQRFAPPAVYHPPQAQYILAPQMPQLMQMPVNTLSNERGGVSACSLTLTSRPPVASLPVSTPQVAIRAPPPESITTQINEPVNIVRHDSNVVHESQSTSSAKQNQTGIDVKADYVASGDSVKCEEMNCSSKETSRPPINSEEEVEVITLDDSPQQSTDQMFDQPHTQIVDDNKCVVCCQNEDTQIFTCPCGCFQSFHRACHLPNDFTYDEMWVCTACDDEPEDLSAHAETDKLSPLDKHRCERLLMRLLCAHSLRVTVLPDSVRLQLQALVATFSNFTTVAQFIRTVQLAFKHFPDLNDILTEEKRAAFPGQ